MFIMGITIMRLWVGALTDMHDHKPESKNVVTSNGRLFCILCADFLEPVPQHLVPEYIKDKYKSEE